MDWFIQMMKAVSYIEEHLTEEVNIQQIAKEAAISEWEFQRIFTFLTKMTAAQYIRQRRLALAAKELLTTQEKVIDLALKYGYESPAAFSRAFHQQYQIAPSAARKAKMKLPDYPRLTSQTIWKGWHQAMSKFSERGYLVKETGPVYATNNMKQTCAWFETVLGWYSDIVDYNKNGEGLYGCVYDVPHEIAMSHIAPFHGIHLFQGQPLQITIAFIQIQGIEAMYEYVRKQGWEKITEVEVEQWGSKTCKITTVDGYLLHFFEPIHG